eukprot:2190851-Ditylum_brightwellii.AAC.1
MSWLAEGCRNLHQLDFTGCESLTDISLSYLFKGCTRLKILLLKNCYKITDHGLQALTPDAG